MRLSHILFTLAVAANTVLAWQPDYILRISNQTIASDCQPRSSVVVNGTAPGPLLTFQEGQHYWVRVFNDLPDQNTTIHFHGFTQYTTPFSDGTPLTSQWPIPPGHFYDYEFNLEDGFHGTYWYHSHVNMQVLTAQGPVIVEPKNKTAPIDYDEDIVMMLSDDYHASDETIVAGLLNTSVFGWLGEPQNLLVNGHAPGECNETALSAGQTCNVTCGNNLQKVLPGKKYRVRVIGATVLSYIGLALEGHNMTVIEVDGTYVEPYPVVDLELGAGQRYSVIIETMQNPPKHDYHWRLRTMWRPTRVNGSALWQYDDDAPSNCPYDNHGPVSSAATPTNLNETVYLPEEKFGWYSDDFVQWNSTEYPPTDDEVTRVIVLNGQQLVAGKSGFRWSVNNHLYNGTTPHVPYLVGLYSENPTERMPNYSIALQHGGYDPLSNTYPAKLGEVLDIVIENHAGPTSGMAEAHPWHSHGRKYWDMGSGTGNFSYAALNASRAAAKGLPYLRDTSVVYPSPGAAYNGSVTGNYSDAGWRLFRIKVEDPGTWLVHCHITPHQVMGMMTVFMYGAEDLAPIPESLVHEFLTYGGGAYGERTYSYSTIPRSFFSEMKRAAEELRMLERIRRSAKGLREYVGGGRSAVSADRKG
ncbi:multi-copper oxidase laccase-like protein [Kockovaella imperatae]|uniref:laccase n=1 Tax=Kockovaella imperatae TaxID=4999 RepID=A0A1Y1U6B0_9TREE|nr:multi-copper oxidase laccase-like protein [Kockovaella imperatae]ORX33571.1 multi-copper oxidase laccase-like protein [Kockovaella imperatae]